MALDLNAIRKGLAANAKTAAGLADAKEFRPDSSHSGRAFWVEVRSVRRSAQTRGRWAVICDGYLISQGAHDRSKQSALDELIEPVWSALESDLSLGGAALTVNVVEADVTDPDLTAPDEVRFEIHVEA